MPFNGIQPRSPNLPLIDFRGITSHATASSTAPEQPHGERYTSLDSAECLEPEVSLEVAGVVNGVLNLIDTTLHAMIDEPPLLPPIDSMFLSERRTLGVHDIWPMLAHLLVLSREALANMLPRSY
eukprot:2439684-Amphidinium_carterae.2